MTPQDKIGIALRAALLAKTVLELVNANGSLVRVVMHQCELEMSDLRKAVDAIQAKEMRSTPECGE